MTDGPTRSFRRFDPVCCTQPKELFSPRFLTDILKRDDELISRVFYRIETESLIRADKLSPGRQQKTCDYSYVYSTDKYSTELLFQVQRMNGITFIPGGFFRPSIWEPAGDRHPPLPPPPSTPLTFSKPRFWMVDGCCCSDWCKLCFAVCVVAVFLNSVQWVSECASGGRRSLSRRATTAYNRLSSNYTPCPTLLYSTLPYTLCHIHCSIRGVEQCRSRLLRSSIQSFGTEREREIETDRLA